MKLIPPNPFILKSKRKELDRLQVGDEVIATYKINPAFASYDDTQTFRGRIVDIDDWWIVIEDKDGVRYGNLAYALISLQKV